MPWEMIFAAAWPVLEALLVVLVGFYAIKWVLKAADKAAEKANVDALLRQLLQKVLRIALWIVVIMSALNAAGIPTSGVLAGLAAAGAAVALALKDSLSNIAGGIVLLLTPRFRAGDYIQIGDKEGEVVKVDLLHTVLLTVTHTQISLPNGVLANSTIVNYSQEKLRRVDLEMPVPYECDIQQAKKILFETIRSQPEVVEDKDHEAVARICRFDDSAVMMSTRCWCRKEDYWTVYFRLMEEFFLRLGKEGITVPYNHVDVNILPPENK